MDSGSAYDVYAQQSENAMPFPGMYGDGSDGGSVPLPLRQARFLWGAKRIPIVDH